MKNLRACTYCLFVSALLAGCGGSSSSPSSDSTVDRSPTNQDAVVTADGQSNSSSRDVLPAADTKKRPPAIEEDDDTPIEAPNTNTPEWFIYQITQLKLKPLNAAAQSGTQQLVRERNEQIIDLATEAIARTHQDKKKERVFDLAVHHLLEAEQQLALTGDQEHVNALYEHASSLYERDKESKAAIEAGQSLVTLARMNAQRYGKQEPKWLTEYARLARQFADNFPQKERLAAPLLFAAGQSCEYHGLTNEAIQCYALIRERYAKSNAGELVTPILRRLNLKGKPIQLAGPTIGGGYLKSEELLGRAILVVFWSTQAQPFVRQLPTLQKLLEQINPERLHVITVNFDDDDNDSAVQTFMETNGLNWQTIFFSEDGKRGWNNPLATHYGIHSVPQYWLVSAKGNVVEMANDVSQIEPLLSRLATAK